MANLLSNAPVSLWLKFTQCIDQAQYNLDCRISLARLPFASTIHWIAFSHFMTHLSWYHHRAQNCAYTLNNYSAQPSNLELSRVTRISTHANQAFLRNRHSLKFHASHEFPHTHKPSLRYPRNPSFSIKPSISIFGAKGERNTLNIVTCCSSSSAHFTPHENSRSRTHHVYVLHSNHRNSHLIILRITFNISVLNSAYTFIGCIAVRVPRAIHASREYGRTNHSVLSPTQVTLIVIGPLSLHHFNTLSLNSAYVATYSSLPNAQYHPSRECLHSNSSHLHSPHNSSYYFLLSYVHISSDFSGNVWCPLWTNAAYFLVRSRS